MKKISQVFSKRFIVMNFIIPIIWLFGLHYSNLKFFDNKFLPVISLMFSLIGSNLNSLASRISSEMNYTINFITISKKNYIDLFLSEIVLFIFYNLVFITMYSILFCIFNNELNKIILILNELVVPGMMFSTIIASIGVTLALTMKPNILDKVITIVYFSSIYFIIFIKQLFFIPNVPNFIRVIQKFMPSTFWVKFINYPDYNNIIYLILEMVLVLFISTSFIMLKRLSRR